MRTAEATPAGPDRRVTKGMAAGSLRRHPAGATGACLAGTEPMTPRARSRRTDAAGVRDSRFNSAVCRMLGGQRGLDQSA
ncbi:hypothetical protein XarbCFBP8152_04265 [Xanthomonas arboricola]|nr:hypothetical protein XarbCFBP8152_04265 [Xanthomonas arboricola]